MSYTKQVWNTGEKITADKLNHMEDGIAEAGGGGTLLIRPTNIETVEGCQVTTWNVSASQLFDAWNSGQLVKVKLRISEELVPYQPYTVVQIDIGESEGVPVLFVEYIYGYARIDEGLPDRNVALLKRQNFDMPTSEEANLPLKTTECTSSSGGGESAG